MAVSQVDYDAMEQLYEDAHEKVIEAQAEMEAVNLRIARIELLAERLLAKVETLQVCRDCGVTFPFDPDADRCERCAPRDEALDA